MLLGTGTVGTVQKVWEGLMGARNVLFLDPGAGYTLASIPTRIKLSKWKLVTY